VKHDTDDNNTYSNSGTAYTPDLYSWINYFAINPMLFDLRARETGKILNK
jgi:hypothetical protein